MNEEIPQDERHSEREPEVSRGGSLGTTGRLRYELRQSFHYRYSGPVRELKQQLLIVPRPQHGAQRLTSYRLLCTDPEGVVSRSHDDFDNLVVRVQVPHVPESVEFRIEAVVERSGVDNVTLPAEALHDARYMDPTPLTATDGRLSNAAYEAAGLVSSALEAAERLCHLIHASLAYQKGATSVGTSAAEAFGIGRGVCQDHAHVMIAMCRAIGIPARYVSGHLLGEGSTHAWVEVVLPHPNRPDLAVAVPFDPCHRRHVDETYVTVAVGRDYHDVAPASGSYVGKSSNVLTSATWLGVSEVRMAKSRDDGWSGEEIGRA